MFNKDARGSQQQLHGLSSVVQQQQAPSQQQQSSPAQAQAQQQQHSSEAHIPPLLGVAPLGPVTLNKDMHHQYKMLEAAFSHIQRGVAKRVSEPYSYRLTVNMYFPYNQCSFQQERE